MVAEPRKDAAASPEVGGLAHEARPPPLLPLPPPPPGAFGPRPGGWGSQLADKWVIDTMSMGYRIQFRRRPPFSRGVDQTVVTDPLRAQALESEIAALLRKGAIREIDPGSSPPGFYSRYFLVPKASGGLRPILDLRRLNTYVKVLPFKMLTSTQVLSSVSEGEWFTLVDLKDAYFHVPIHPLHRRFLRFAFGGRVYEFWVLPFGLSLSPRVFTRVVAAALAPLHEEGLRILPYLDDWLIQTASHQQAVRDTARVVSHIQDLGFRLNWEKSVLMPSQRVTFVGMTLDSASMLATLPPRRVESLLGFAQEFRIGALMSLGQHQRLAGLMVAAAPVVPLGLLETRRYQRWLNMFALDPKADRSVVLRVTARCWRALRKWRDGQFLAQGVPLRGVPAERIVVTTDASLHGWGAVCQGQSTSGVWDSTWRRARINVLETRAVYLALMALMSQIQGRHVLVRSDSVTAVYFINHQGGTRSAGCLSAARSVLELAQERLLSLRAVHVKGSANTAADLLSRGGPQAGEWRLHPEVVRKLWEAYGEAEVDLFASAETSHCSTWFSEETDALAQRWPVGRLLYAFPPFGLLPALIRRIELGNHKVVVVAPRWTGRPWFPRLMGLLVGRPLQLPIRRDLLSQGRGEIWHPCPEALRLWAWPLVSLSRRRTWTRR